MGIEDRDWYREHHRNQRDADRRSGSGPPAPRAGSALAMLVAVLAAGCAAVAGVMAYATGQPIAGVLEQAWAVMASDLGERRWMLPGVAGLVAALALASAVRGRLQAVLVWAVVVGIAYAVSDALLLRQQAVLEVRLPGSGTVELHRAPNGHYMVAGAVNGVPVRFMVDTGASVTSIPQELARKARITACVPRTFSTAAGVSPGCVGRASTLTFAGLRLTDAQVAVMPLMQGPALLGMDVLSRLQIEQRGSVMKLGPTSER